MRDWPVFALRDVAEIVSGITIGRKARVAELVDVPYMRVANVKDGVLDLSQIKSVAATAREIEKWKLHDGDLLLTEGGDLDKLGRGACWRNQLPLCIHQNHIFRVRLPADRYDADFVSYQTGSAYGKAYFLAHAKKTTGIASINQGVLGAFPLFSPPLTEQRQIAACLKLQLAEVDTTRQAAQAQLREITLLRNRLLRQTFDALHEVPQKVLGEWARTTSGSTPPRGDQRYWSSADIPWVKTGEVAFAPITSTGESISRQALKECSLTLLPPRTVLIAMIGQGKTRAQSAILKVEATTNQNCFAILPNDTWDTDFLHHWLMASYQDLRDLSASRGGSQSALNGALLNALKIPAPDLDEQRRIVQRLQAQLAEVNTIAQTATTQLSEIERLPQRLLAQAFGAMS